MYTVLYTGLFSIVTILKKCNDQYSLLKGVCVKAYIDKLGNKLYAVTSSNGIFLYPYLLQEMP